MSDTRHDCPGHCGRRVARSRLACAPCWFRLPEQMRATVTRADNIRRRKPRDADAIRGHRSAIVAAFNWYRDNTPAGNREGTER